MRYLYTIILYLLLPFILLRLWIKNRKKPSALKFWYERLGLETYPTPQKGIWVHAVSVGESIAAIPLIKGLQLRYPTLPIMVTTETANGAHCIRLGLGTSVTQRYAPYDLPIILKKFFNTLKPRILIIMETELWPNVLAECRKRSIPVVLANARLSIQSARGYRRVLKLTQEMLKTITLIIAQSQADADRFIELGFPQERMKITGTIKFDLEIPNNLNEQAKQIREQWGKDRFILIAASTHAGEEAQILNAFKLVRKKLTNVLLVSVPRHIERTPRLESFYQSQGYSITKRSDNESGVKADIFIGDTMGELLTFYAAADVAFVGGSLVKKGGQNPLEPAAIGMPILTGPHTFNFGSITELLKKRGIAIQVNNALELAEQIIKLSTNIRLRQEIGLKAKKFILENKGSVRKHLELIAPIININ